MFQDDCFHLTGYYCSNTALKSENPNGERFTALYLKDKKNVLIDGNGATLLVHGKIGVENNQFKVPPQGATVINVGNTKTLILKNNRFEGGHKL